MSALGFIPDVLIMSISLFFMAKHREKLARFFSRAPWGGFLLAAVFFTLIEENINSGFSFFIIPFVPWTVVILTLEIALFAWIFRKTSTIKWPLIAFIAFGVFWELTFGPLGQALPTLPIWFSIFMIIWVALSYMYCAIIPFTMQKLAKHSIKK